jgi:hypothetical protein
MLLNYKHFSNGYFPVYPSMYPTLNSRQVGRLAFCGEYAAL